MSGTALGVRKTAAARLGLSLEEYDGKLAAGERWCTECHAWHPVSEFGVDRSRGCGLKAACRAGIRRRYHALGHRRSARGSAA